MRRAIVTTNGTARAFQLAALLLVGACVLFVLVHRMANGRAPVAAPPDAAGSGPRPSGAYPRLPGSERYRAEACGGDYVCDELGAWEALPIQSQPRAVASRSQ